ncbi:dTMP kinase [Pigmentibacter sp. JX0631]|uniref:dTMP kinase n=1 Tax=Pigmentibacter sp. JX0631 TaxID=2976982 RepID=UPI002468D5C8|nr:dTMP kinase [Pigmentibacter sp. JX0631]WGL60123.1 dTMP kinase [Pigmentibacter sp. JX0631]
MAFIVFEGGEGAGKTTQLEFLHKALKKQGKICLLTREPGGTPFAEQIRSLFKQVDPSIESPLPLTELLLVSASRAQHVAKVIQPELGEKKIILCDRFLDSTYVYQSILGKIPKQTIDKISHIFLEDLVPDLTFIFSADLDIALQRMAKEKKRTLDRMDSQEKEIHQVIKEGYTKIYQERYTYPNGKVPNRVLIDANQSKEQIHMQIKVALEKHLGISI